MSIGTKVFKLGLSRLLPFSMVLLAVMVESTQGADVYGTVAIVGGRESRPVSEAKIDLVCRRHKDTTKTDQYGRYHFAIPDCQTCKVVVHCRNQEVVGTLTSYAAKA